MSVISIISLSAVFLISSAAEVKVEQKNDECAPPPLQPGQKAEMCCKIPEIMDTKGEDKKKMKETFDSCMAVVKERAHEILPEGAPAKSPGQHPHPPVKLMECLQECVFNQTGLIKDAKVDPEALNKAVLDMIGNAEAWKPIASAAIKTCAETSPKNVKEDAVCKSGAHEMTICTMREMYLNCPADSWTDNDYCKAEKARVEKCPGLIPPHRHHHPHPHPHPKSAGQGESQPPKGDKN